MFKQAVSLDPAKEDYFRHLAAAQRKAEETSRLRDPSIRAGPSSRERAFALFVGPHLHESRLKRGCS